MLFTVEFVLMLCIEVVCACWKLGKHKVDVEMDGREKWWKKRAEIEEKVGRKIFQFHSKVK